jgi:hypothetical protein
MEVSGQLHVPVYLPQGKDPWYYWIGGWVGPVVGLDAAAKRNNPCPCWESNPGRQSHSLVTVLSELPASWNTTCILNWQKSKQSPLGSENLLKAEIFSLVLKKGRYDGQSQLRLPSAVVCSLKISATKNNTVSFISFCCAPLNSSIAGFGSLWTRLWVCRTASSCMCLQAAHRHSE